MQLGNVLYFLVWAGLIFLIMRYGCGAHVIGHVHHHGGQRSDGSWTLPDKTVDPVCGMTIATQGAKSSIHAGHVYYFCSASCRDKFEAAPASYAKPELSSQHERHHPRAIG